MNLSLSNIAWPAELDAPVYDVLRANEIHAIEVAPTRVWPHWQGISASAVREFRQTVEDSGLRISSLQSILFDRPDLQLFGSPATRESLYRHLRKCADLAAGLGAACMVFGAPRNRDRGAHSEEDAFAIAAEFFARAGACCAHREIYLGFEPNPADYDCNFATDSATAARLVRAVRSPGFKLHLDTACLHLAHEDAARAIRDNADILCHVHVSEPYLATFAAPQVAHHEIADALETFDKWVSLEMRAAHPPLPAIEHAVHFLKNTYLKPVYAG